MESLLKQSRKYKLAQLAILLITVVALLGVKYAAISTVLPSFVGGILGVLGLYFTGNVTQKVFVKPIEPTPPEGEKE